jgi:uncharacterized membrane protein
MSSDAEDAVEDLQNLGALRAEAVVVAENSLLNLVLVNRLQRKAKSVGITAFEFCLVVGSLLWQIDDSYWSFPCIIVYVFLERAYSIFIDVYLLRLQR